MKLVKSLLLGSVAGMAAVAGAQAADLPFRKAAPVEYVRVCDWTGAGYFYIPGTDTCLKVGGFVRAEYGYVSAGRQLTPAAAVGTAGFAITPSRARAQTGFFLRGRIDVDARTQTAYGTLRTYVRYQMDRLSGNYNGSNGTTGSSSAYIDKGFIQFAGFTAGRVQSFFDFYADNYNFDGIANSDDSTQVLAYTATFGGGFSATISMEDRDARNYSGIGTALTAGNPLITAGNQVGYAGQTIPDIVGAVRVDQAWGAAQLSAAYHDVNTVGTLGGAVLGRTTDGYAINAGIQIKLPMLAAGDDLWIDGGYMNGAVTYQEEAGNFSAGFYGQLLSGFQHIDHDAIAVGNGAGGFNLTTPTGFHVLAAIHHYFTPQFHDVLYGSYEEISYANSVRNIDWTLGGIGNASEFRVGNQFIFTPVHNFDIGLDLMYARIDQQLAHNPGVAATPLPVGIKKNGDAFQARLRLERDF